jgi:hypothetical protein
VIDQLIGAIAQVSDQRNCSGKNSRTPAETDQLDNHMFQLELAGLMGRRKPVLLGSSGHSTPRARARAFLYPTGVFQPRGPAITGDGTGAYIVTIVHGERDAPDGARFLHSDVEGEPPGRVTVHYGLLDGTPFERR